MEKFSKEKLLADLIAKYAYLQEEDNATAYRVYEQIMSSQPKK
jgi:hypothetical protein